MGGPSAGTGCARIAPGKVCIETNRPPAVLVVSFDEGRRGQLQQWVEEAGFEAMGCPGPGEPVTCPQIRGRRCPLAAGADVVVLDTELEGDLTAASAPGWVLLDTYLERGSRVVALADPGSEMLLREQRCIDARDLLAGVEEALSGERAGTVGRRPPRAREPGRAPGSWRLRNL